MQITIDNLPHYFFGGSGFNNLEGYSGFTESNGKLVVYFFRTPLKAVSPPTGDINDIFKRFLGSDICRNAGMVVLLLHMIYPFKVKLNYRASSIHQASRGRVPSVPRSRRLPRSYR